MGLNNIWTEKTSDNNDKDENEEYVNDNRN